MDYIFLLSRSEDRFMTENDFNKNITKSLSELRRSFKNLFDGKITQNAKGGMNISIYIGKKI